MQKSTYCALALVALLCAQQVNGYFRIDLKKVDVSTSTLQYPAYGDVAATTATPQTKFVSDQIYTFSLELGQGDNSFTAPATADVSSLSNWFLTKESIINGQTNEQIYECVAPCKYLLNNGAQVYWPTTDLLMSYESSLEAADNNKKVVTSYDSFTDYGVNVGRLHFGMTTVAPLNIAKNATNKIAVGSTELKNVPFLVPSVTNVKRTTDNTVYNFLQQASISLGKPNSQLPSQSNFVNVYNDQKQLAELGFSFYFNNNIPQLIIGEAENFFSNGKQVVINNIFDDTFWGAQLVKLHVGTRLVGCDQNCQCDATTDGIGSVVTASGLGCKTYADTDQHFRSNQASSIADKTVFGLSIQNPIAYFDSTSRYIRGHASQVKALVDVINGFGVSCIFNAYQEQYRCLCEQNTAFPDIKFYFEGAETTPLILTKKDYVFYEKDPNKENCVLLIKPHDAQFTENASQFKADNTIDYQNENIQIRRGWVLGTSFLSGNYCHFSQSQNSITCSRAYEFVPQTIQFDDTARIAVLVLGSILLVGALSVLLSLFTKVQPFHHTSVPLPPAENPPTRAFEVAAPPPAFIRTSQQVPITASYFPQTAFQGSAYPYYQR